MPNFDPLKLSFPGLTIRILTLTDKLHIQDRACHNTKVNSIKKINLLRRRGELKLQELANRFTSLGATLTANLNKSQPKEKVFKHYKIVLGEMEEQFNNIKKLLSESEGLLQQQKKKERLKQERDENA